MKRFIDVINYNDGDVLTLSVDGIQGIYADKEGTIINHSGHNNGGYIIKETRKEVLELIKNSTPI